MDDKRLAEIEARVRAIAPTGKWWWDFWHGENGKTIAGIEAEHPPLDDHYILWFWLEHHDAPEMIAPLMPLMDFIAASREDVPDLLAEVRRLRRENEHWRTTQTTMYDPDAELKARNERLRQENERLRDALQRIADAKNAPGVNTAMLYYRMEDMAKAALKETDNG